MERLRGYEMIEEELLFNILLELITKLFEVFSILERA